MNDIDEETKILFDALTFYCNLRIPNNSKLSRRYHQFLQQIFSSDCILQLITPNSIPFLHLYSVNGQVNPKLGALIPALGMLFRNLCSESQDPQFELNMMRILQRLCGMLAERAQRIYDNLLLHRETVVESSVECNDLSIQDWQQTGCYYGRKPCRLRPFYEGKDVDKTGNVIEEGTCRKLYSTYGKKSLTGGLMALWCPHLVCLGFHKMPNAEGRNDVFSAIFKYWEQAPKVVIYDFACQLGPYCLSREPEFFKDTLFAIDEMHANGHTQCSQACFISNYMQVRPQLMPVNSSAAECSNSGLNRIRKSVSYMSQRHAILLTYIYLCVWNRKQERLFREEAKKSLARV